MQTENQINREIEIIKASIKVLEKAENTVQKAFILNTHKAWLDALEWVKSDAVEHTIEKRGY